MEFLPGFKKELSKELALPHSILFNKSIESGVLPVQWKTAIVTPVFQKGTSINPGYYQPIILTCILCKVLESIVRDVIVDYMQANDVLTDCQHAVRSKRSCNTQLPDVIEDLTIATENN